ncbi:MAG: YbbR-like domain-containing protein, partial [Anaeromassilibacillus sp.]
MTGPVSNYTLELSATKLGNLSNYEVVSIEPSSILVTVDYYSEKVFNIDTSQITPPVDPQYYLNTPTLSSDSVTVSGPKQEVDQVAKVTIPYEQDKTPLTETKHFTGRLVMLDADGNEIKSDNLTLSMESVEVTCNVLYRKVLPLQVEFSGRPSNLTGFESRVTVAPQEIAGAGPEDACANIS